MMNFILISPQFPSTYYKFAQALKKRDFRVLGIGDTPFDQLSEPLKQALTEYYFCPDMNDYPSMYRAVAFFAFKYGRIDWLESHNEWWLLTDAKLREDFNIQTGIKYPDIAKYRKKSLMKQYFLSANIPSARYQLVSDYQGCLEFIKVVGYPLFVKPDVGVGSIDSYKIDNDDQLLNFFETKKDLPYIMEEFIDGQIISYDGITNRQSEVVFESCNLFPIPNYVVVNQMSDDMYYTSPHVPPDLSRLGRQVIRSFDVKTRIFHLEFFRLNRDYPHLGKKGTLVALEVNMRPAGGYTPEMISAASGLSIYEAWADVVAYDELRLQQNGPNYFVGAPSRRKKHQYELSHEQVLDKYHHCMIMHGEYPPLIANGMADYYYIAKFQTDIEVLTFIEMVLRKRVIT